MQDEHDTVEPMTIDDLARLMVHSIEELKEDIRDEFNPRFDRLEGKIDALEARTYSLELKMDAVRSDISTLFFNGKKLTGRVENLEIQTFGSIQTA